MNVKNYWDQSVSYDEYLRDSEEQVERLRNSQEAQEQAFMEYYQLGLTRMHRALKTFKKDEEQDRKLAEKAFKGKILIISEGWCGDASQIVPALIAFFEGKNEARLIYRDRFPDLIDQYLTNGSRSIPIVLILDEEYNVVAHWGPRPAAGTEMLKKHKAAPETYTIDMFHNDLQVYYSKNRGKDTVEEILELL